MYVGLMGTFRKIMVYGDGHALPSSTFFPLGLKQAGSNTGAAI